MTMKASEVLKQLLPIYSRYPYMMFMCCLVNDSYDSQGYPNRLPFSRGSQPANDVRALIIERMRDYCNGEYHGTLDGALIHSNERYKELHDKIRWMHPDDPDMKELQEEQKQLRIQWYENLIIQLEKEGL